MTSKQAQSIELICGELSKVLAGLMRAPAMKGQQIVIHISKDRREVWIEKPAEMIRIRLDGMHD